MGLQDSESTTSSAEPPMAPAATGAKNAKGGKSQFNEYSARSFGITMCPGCGKHFGSEEAVNKHATGKGKSKKKSCAQALRQLREALAKDESSSVRKTASFFEFSLCLSRACLGKVFVFLYKWLKNAVFRRLR